MIRLLLLSIALGLAGPAQAAAAATTADIERAARTSVVMGQRLTLRLPNRVESGRTWFLINSPAPELQYVSQRFERPEIELPDVARNQIFEFNTKKPGVKVLRFGYGVGPGQPVSRILNVTVTIKGK